MGWLIAQTWLLLLVAFLLGCGAAWLAARLFVSPGDTEGEVR
jgi:hypothetical protein